MLLELPPELINPILTSLRVKDLKNLSLCSKQCNRLVAQTLWKNVKVSTRRLHASRSVPNHIAFSRNLCIFHNGYSSLLSRFIKKEEQNFTKKLVALLKLSSLTTLRLFGLKEVSIVTLCLATISEQTGLKNLIVRGCHINAGLEHIGRLTGLVNLDISRNGKISDAGLEHLRCLTGLENLNVRGYYLSDAGLEHIGRLTGLVNLNISYNTKISDAGLKHFSCLTGVKNLNVRGCKISDAPFV